MAGVRRASDVVLVVVALLIDLYVYDSDRELRWGGLAPLWLVPALTVLVYATLPWRWRYPRAIFAIQWCYGLAGVVLPRYAPFAGLLIALHAAATSLPRRWSGAALGLSFVALTVDNYDTAAMRSTGALDLFVSLSLAWLSILTAIWLTGRRTYLTARRAELQRRSQEQAATEAVQSERVQLARELHDTVAHALTAMIVQAAGANAVLLRDAEQARECLSTIERVGVRAMDELRRLLGLLRVTYPAVDAAGSSAATPTLADIEHLIALAREAGIDVEIAEEGTRSGLDPSVETAAYRVVQEGLTNASKHAGPGALVGIHLVWLGDGLTVTVRSAAGSRRAGAPSLPPSGFGIKGLTERLVLVGGSLQAGPAGESGDFLLRARLPLSGRPRQHLTEEVPE